MTYLRRLPVLESSIVAAALVVLAAAGYFKAALHDPAPNMDSYSSYDSGGGGYRAWYELLERESVRTMRFEARPAFLDRSIDTLVYAEPLAFDPRQEPVSETEAKTLEAWVREGGHLVYLGSDDEAAKAGILKLPRTAKPARRDGPVRGDAAAGVRTFEARGDLRWRPARGKAILLADARGALVLHYPLGRGTVTTAIDERMFANERIALHDHARLAYALARPRNPRGIVAFDEMPHGYLVPEHWWAIVPRPLLTAVIVVVLALLVAYGGAAVRLGPPLVPPARREPTSAEFIDALAGLLQRGDSRSDALQEAFASAARAASARLRLPGEVPAREIAAHLEREEDRRDFGELAALAAGPVNEAAFVRGVNLARRLRKDL